MKLAQLFMKVFMLFIIFLPTIMTGATTQAQAPDVLPYAGAPLCATHDPLAFHTLWNAQLGCHYDHSHGDNPHEVDDIFGTAYLNATGGDLQMPWQPAGTDPIDTDRKHDGLFWMVRKGETCYSQFGTGCLTDFRAEVHHMADPPDTFRRQADGSVVATFHVARIEARVCDQANPTNCGIVRLASRQYLGDTFVDSQLLFDFPEPNVMWPGTRTVKPDSLNYYNIGQRSNTNWYPVNPNGLFRVATQIEDVWAAVNPADPFTVTMLGGNNNSSKIAPHLVGIDITPRIAKVVNADGNGYADYSGFVDVNGFFVPTCTQVGTGCIPVSYEHVPVGPAYQYRGESRDYDIYFNGVSSGWITYAGHN